jgi:hypothetical protein
MSCQKTKGLDDIDDHLITSPKKLRAFPNNSDVDTRTCFHLPVRGNVPVFTNPAEGQSSLMSSQRNPGLVTVSAPSFHLLQGLLILLLPKAFTDCALRSRSCDL